MWLQSAAQVFFSLGLGFGGLIALSSYNPVNNNCYRDAVKVSLVNFFTSIYAGIVIFAILGYKAHMSYDKCLVQREQTINYYLSDYYLKAFDYGSAFDPVNQNIKEGKQDEAVEAIESSSFETASRVSDGTTNGEIIASSIENNGEDEDDRTTEEKDEREEVKLDEEKRRRQGEKGKIKVKGEAKGKVNERKTRSYEDNASKESAKTKINQDKKSEIKSPEQPSDVKEKKRRKKKKTTKGNSKEKPLDVISSPSSSSVAAAAKIMTKTTSELPNTSISAESKSTTSTTSTTTTTTTTTTQSTTTTATEASTTKPSSMEQQLEENVSTNSDLEGSSADYYDSSDAIASIRSLDKQLDLAFSKESFDYGDSDTEFKIDTSSLISKSDLDKVIEKIPDLQKCSVRNELDEATKGTGLVFIVMAEAISQFENAPIWAMGFFFMLLMLGLDSQFGNLEGLLSSIADLNSVNSIKRQWITGKRTQKQ